MSSVKPECIFFSENLLGGVQSYYFNLVSNDPFLEFDKKWILVDKENAEDAKLPALFGTGFEEVFTYAGDDNAYEYGRALSKLISNRPGIVMVNHEIELTSLYLYPKSEKTIVFVCHDENYIPIARNYHFIIDTFIAHNSHFADRLKEEFPNRVADIYYKPYGIPMAPVLRKQEKTSRLSIVFLARFHKNKGIFLLPLIDDQLKELGVEVDWTLIGDGPELGTIKEKTKHRNNFSFRKFEHNHEVLGEIKNHDIFVLPSYLEGLPVSLLEAMSAGLVPIITRFNPGIGKVVSDEEGFIVEMDDYKAIAGKIKFLNDNRELLDKMGSACRAKIEANFDIKLRAKDYFEFFREYRSLKRQFPREKLKFGHRLDHPLIPKRLRKALRKWK